MFYYRIFSSEKKLMLKYLPIFFLLNYLNMFSQISDSLYNILDSLKVDSISVNAAYDSLSALDSSLVREETVLPDTLIPLQAIPLTDVSKIIVRRSFLFYNYRYTGDFPRSYLLNFIKDLAFMGQPNESFIYGVGNGGISFMQDGVLWNNRFTNSLDLNHIQSEDIDSIEIVPSPRGFLYGTYNNPVTVNFIMKDFLSREPYSRIKYYEGPYGEAMIDGKFSARIYKRWNLSFELTNRSADDRYINSDYSIWQVNTKLKYFLSNSVNLSAIYSFVDSDVGLNGGVDVDSISNITSDINSILYDNLSAPVVYPNRVRSVINHNVSLRMQAIPYTNAKLDLTTYYKYDLVEINDNRDTINTTDSNENKTIGVSLNYNQNWGFTSLQILGNYEKSDIGYNLNINGGDSVQHSWDKNYISGAAIFSGYLLDKTLIPSVFYRYTNEDISYFNPETIRNLSGYGIDITYIINNALSFYGGYSSYEQRQSDNNVNTFELGSKYISKNLFVELRYFSRRDLFLPSDFIPPFAPDAQFSLVGNVDGIGLSFSYQYWKILIESNASYYFARENDKLINLPDVQFINGIYLNDMFFDGNLKLKAGFVFYYTGQNFIPGRDINVDASNKIDFTFAGEIRRVAIVYFAWENLFNNQYFITPFYPMPERNIRFGFSWELFN